MSLAGDRPDHHRVADHRDDGDGDVQRHEDRPNGAELRQVPVLVRVGVAATRRCRPCRDVIDDVTAVTS